MSMRQLAVLVILAGIAASLDGQEEGSGAPKARPVVFAGSGASHKVARGGGTRRSPKEPASLPLSPRERAQQMLNRFTFGPRPGEVERVLALGADTWFEQQLDPRTVNDDALNRRLNDFPTLGLTPEQALLRFPDRGAIGRVAKGQAALPADPPVRAVYEVQVAKYNAEQAKIKADTSGKKTAEGAEAEAAEQKKAGQAEAARIAGDLFSLPRNQRMAALLALPVAERIDFTSYLQGDQRTLLLAEFNPREREVFSAMSANIDAAGQMGQELSQAKMVRAILSERQLQEVMADFWFNHFNIFLPKDADRWYTSSFDREAIRKNALGKFRDLLMATATSPAMMVYLDNWLSVGPEALANAQAKPGGKRGNQGLNENYGREVMELHTVGVNGGYTQADVTALASILTGWGVNNPAQAGPFLFDPRRHEPGTKFWFGHTLGSPSGALPATGPPSASAAPQPGVPAKPDPGMQEGIDALRLLAASPRTAHFISWKLAQRFVADDPPAALVDRMAGTYLATDGDLRAILRTLVQSPEFNSRIYFRNKVKTPVEYLASAFRTTATDPGNPGALVGMAQQMGMPVFVALAPTGYLITADHWMNSSALVARLNFAYQLTNSKFGNQKFDAAHVLALGLLAQPATSQTVSKRVGVVQPVAFAAGAEGGVDVALRVLETTLIGARASAQTNALIHRQVDPQSGMSPTDRLNLLTALVLGSPEFQLR